LKAFVIRQRYYTDRNAGGGGDEISPFDGSLAVFFAKKWLAVPRAFA
jgi:hypothetical protein